MKKLLMFMFSALLMLNVVNAEEKVKVYMFEAGGCPYCEAQEDYLKKLDGYGTKFELIKKELYVDHVDWAEGKDYELGKKVAEVFQDAGFEDASYMGTPFVVISDLYASASYNTSLESVIDAAYKEGDKDAVSCINEGKTDCVRKNSDTGTLIDNASAKAKEDNKTAGIVLTICGCALFVGAIVYVLKNQKSEIKEEKEVLEVSEEKDEEVKEDKKVEKKVPAKKTSTKKKTVKKTNK